ncbi:hypothetical protein DL767_003769 [Monosporascus sp. MG133]|nr:hypothetical protein DL767_003769 [Monosporascus sp. MG133]
MSPDETLASDSELELSDASLHVPSRRAHEVLELTPVAVDQNQPSAVVPPMQQPVKSSPTTEPSHERTVGGSDGPSQPPDETSADTAEDRVNYNNRFMYLDREWGCRGISVTCGLRRTECWQANLDDDPMRVWITQAMTDEPYHAVGQVTELSSDVPPGFALDDKDSSDTGAVAGWVGSEGAGTDITLEAMISVDTESE